MKCPRCGKKAVINMRQHKLALCKEHFLEWLPGQVQRAIHKYHMFTPQERVLVAVSGGKDSLSLWDILNRLGYQADGLYIGLGIDEDIAYSAVSRRLSEQFARQRGLTLHVVDLEEHYGETLPQLANRTLRGRARPCGACGLIKRHEMNRVARQGGYNVLATGHNLDDEAAVLMANTIHWLSGYIVRQGPVLEADRPGVVRKVKPLCRTYERETAAYALLSGIEYIYEECPFSIEAKALYYKQILDKMELDTPGTKLQFYLTFLQAKESGLFSPLADAEAGKLHACPKCDQATTAPGLCAFCRMFEDIDQIKQ